MQELKTVLEQHKNIIEEAIQSWLSVNTAKKIKDDVHKLLDRAIGSITRGLLGFERDPWDNTSWRIDHCNGRGTIISEFINAQAKKAITQWMNENFETEAMKALEECKEGFNKEVKEVYLSNFKSKARELIAARLQADINREFEKASRDVFKNE